MARRSSSMLRWAKLMALRSSDVTGGWYGAVVKWRDEADCVVRR